jgi:hypothetical protein
VAWLGLSVATLKGRRDRGQSGTTPPSEPSEDGHTRWSSRTAARCRRRTALNKSHRKRGMPEATPPPPQLKGQPANAITASSRQQQRLPFRLTMIAEAISPPEDGKKATILADLSIVHLLSLRESPNYWHLPSPRLSCASQWQQIFHQIKGPTSAHRSWSTSGSTCGGCMDGSGENRNCASSNRSLSFAPSPLTCINCRCVRSIP